MDKILAQLRAPRSVEAAASEAGLPRTRGLYAWWILDPGLLPSVPLVPREDGLSLLYVGIAPSGPQSAQTLRSRAVGKHIRGHLGQSTFRRSLAALLWEQEGWTPVWATDRVQLLDGQNQALRNWITTNLRVAWAEHPEPWTVEEEAIERLKPPLNLASNRSHPFFCVIKEARARLEREAILKIPEARPAKISSHVERKTKKKAQVIAQSTTATVTASQLSTELKVDPKQLRLILRALARDGKIEPNTGKWSWTHDSPDLTVIRDTASVGEDGP